MQAFNGSSMTVNFAPQSTVTDQGSNQVTSPLYITADPRRQIDTSAVKSALANPQPGVVLSNPPSTNQQPIYAPSSLCRSSSTSVLPTSSYWESSTSPPPLYSEQIQPTQMQLPEKQHLNSAKSKRKRRKASSSRKHQRRNQISFLNKFSDNMKGIIADFKNYNEIPGQSFARKDELYLPR